MPPPAHDEPADTPGSTHPGDEDWVDRELAIPRVLGDFRLIREVGRGGMGVVYEAEERSLGRRVALKILPIAASLDADQLGRFRREAELVARLAHGNIVPIYAVRRDSGIAYFAMPLIEGRNLADLILEFARPRPIDAGASATAAPLGDDLVALAQDPARVAEFCRAVARLGRQAALALAHLHKAGVLHRDIKPANLIVEPSGHLWLTDFGLATLQDDTESTRSGALVGTIRYMSPEQSAGRLDLIDGRTDVYALGMTLHEALAQTQAFPGLEGRALIERMAVADPPPLRSVVPAIPVDLEAIVVRATSRWPGDRYASAADLAADLGRFLRGRPIRARRPTFVEQWRHWAVQPARTVEAAQSLFWFGILLATLHAATFLALGCGLFRPADIGATCRELAGGFVILDLPLIGAGVRALRGRRDGLIVGALATGHLLAILALQATGIATVGYGGIVGDLRDRWPYPLLFGLISVYTLARIGLGLVAGRARPTTTAAGEGDTPRP